MLPLLAVIRRWLDIKSIVNLYKLETLVYYANTSGLTLHFVRIRPEAAIGIIMAYCSTPRRLGEIS